MEENGNALRTVAGKTENEIEYLYYRYNNVVGNKLY